jgi:hypothetical protein
MISARVKWFEVIPVSGYAVAAAQREDIRSPARPGQRQAGPEHPARHTVIGVAIEHVLGTVAL